MGFFHGCLKRFLLGFLQVFFLLESTISSSRDSFRIFYSDSLRKYFRDCSKKTLTDFSSKLLRGSSWDFFSFSAFPQKSSTEITLWKSIRDFTRKLSKDFSKKLLRLSLDSFRKFFRGSHAWGLLNMSPGILQGIMIFQLFFPEFLFLKFFRNYSNDSSKNPPLIIAPRIPSNASKIFIRGPFSYEFLQKLIQGFHQKYHRRIL